MPLILRNHAKHLRRRSCRRANSFRPRKFDPGGVPRTAPPSGAEQDQRKDGSVKIPEVLQKYMGGMEVICR